MFKKLYDIIENVKELNNQKLTYYIFYNDEVQKIIIDLNRIEQLLYNGELPDGTFLPAYKSSYNSLATFEGKSVTKEKGQPYTLLDTGEFYRSFKVIPNVNGFIITANDEKKNGTLEQMYGNGSKILGLTDENKATLSKEIVPYIIQWTRNQIFRNNR